MAFAAAVHIQIPYKVKWSEVAQSCPTLCDPMDCSPPGSSIHGVLQAIILEWVAISFSRGSSQPKDRNQVACIAGRCFNLWATSQRLWHSQQSRNRCFSGILLLFRWSSGCWQFGLWFIFYVNTGSNHSKTILLYSIP